MTSTTRRSQAERRAETRGRLLDSTVAVIAAEGVAGATTRRICEVADVSQGAMSHHFPTRMDLLAATFEHLADARLRHYDVEPERLAPDLSDRLRNLVRAVRDDMGSGGFPVAVKLLVAAADDPELRARLVPVEERIRDRISELGRRTVTTARLDDRIVARIGLLGLTPADLEDVVSLFVNASVGIAFNASFEPVDRPDGKLPMRGQWELLERLITG